MSIKPWDQRSMTDDGYVLSVRATELTNMQAEIDELRAALLESKDVGLRLLTCRSLFSLARGEINAQRKVLEQALEALHQYTTNKLTVGQRYTNEGQQLLDAITAIQGVLK